MRDYPALDERNRRPASFDVQRASAHVGPMEGPLASTTRSNTTSAKVKPSRSRRTPWIRLLILLGIAVALGWLWQHPVLWPLKVTVVLFHELGHAVATWATGGEVLSITLSPLEGGETLSRGGWRLVILNAGYLGSLLTGMWLLASTKIPMGARLTTLGLGASLLAVSAILVPWLSFGFWFTIGAGIVLLVAGIFLPGIVRRWLLRVLGVFSVLYAGMDVYSDVIARALDLSARSDAVMLAEATGIPAVVWGGGWMLAGLVMLVLGRRWLV